MTTPIPNLIADPACILAEGPLWHPDERRLFWTDIPAGTIYQLDPLRGRYAPVHQGEPVGGMTLQADGALLLFGAGGRIWRWRKGEPARLLAELSEERETRFNDVIADPLGRAIAGTMAQRDEHGTIVRHGLLYLIETNRSARVLLDNVISPNGLGFSLDQRQLYFTESAPGVQAIYRFDYDVTTGSISNRTLIHRTPLDGRDGRPDGLTIDREGWIWSARWDGSLVVRLDPAGNERERYQLPVRRVTSVTFGGTDHSELYITTARADDEDRGRAGGGIFRLRTRARGRAEFQTRIGLSGSGLRQ